MEQAVGYYNLEVYEDSVNLLGIANVTLPSIEYMTATITGAGMMGSMDVPFMGMVNSMKSPCDTEFARKAIKTRPFIPGTASFLLTFSHYAP